MNIHGSCHCSEIRFEIETPWAIPAMACYCQTCTKTNGSPMSPHVKGETKLLKLEDPSKQLKVHRVRSNERHFCGKCGSSLYLTDTRWPEFVYIWASCVDTPLPKVSEMAHIFVGSKCEWFPISIPGPQFEEYPEGQSFEDFL